MSEQQYDAIKLRAALKKKGFSDPIIDSMMKAAKPRESSVGKAAKTKKRWFPGMAEGKSNKPVTVAIPVTCTCTTCGSSSMKTMVLKVKPDSPMEHKTTIRQCTDCIRMLKELPVERLVSIIMMMNNSDIELRMLSTHRQILLSATMTPELVLKRDNRISGLQD